MSKKKLIFSVYIDIDKKNLEPNDSYWNDTIPKSHRTKLELTKFKQRLVQCKQQYAEQCGADFVLFEQDQLYDSFLKTYSHQYEFDAINFYKLFLLEHTSKSYDAVLYLDLDVVPNTDLSFFDHFDMNSINAFAVDSSKEKIWRKPWLESIQNNTMTFDQVVQTFLGRQNMYVKNQCKNAMLAQNFVAGSEYLINTAITGGSSEIIQQCKIFEQWDQHMQTFNDCKQEKFFGKQLTELFFPNNEAFFSYIIENRNIPFNNITQDWHYMIMPNKNHHLGPAFFDYVNIKKSKMLHVIDKKFERIFDMTDNKVNSNDYGGFVYNG